MKHSHKKLEKMVQEYLTSIGYTTIETEHRVKIGNKSYIIDVYGERRKEVKRYGDKDKETIVVECGHIDAKKLVMISTQFDKVIIWGPNVEFQGTDYTKKIHKTLYRINKT